MKRILALLAICLASAYCIDPPLMPESYQMAFDETFMNNGSRYTINGQLYYDSKNNRERVERINGEFDLFCSTVLPNVTTPCSQITVDNKRYIIFQNKRKCCFCCDSAHGCGILRRDWLNEAKYIGQERIIDTQYDKWSKDGDFGYNYFWVTTDNNHIPRRLDENGAHVTNYLINTFLNKTFEDSVFALPSYCTENCPLTSICGKFRDAPTQLTYEQ